MYQGRVKPHTGGGERWNNGANMVWTSRPRGIKTPSRGLGMCFGDELGEGRGGGVAGLYWGTKSLSSVILSPVEHVQSV